MKQSNEQLQLHTLNMGKQPKFFLISILRFHGKRTATKLMKN